MAALSVCISVILTGCSSEKNAQQASITAVGSTALQPFVEAAAEQYTSDHYGVFVNVQGGGSGTGLSQIQEGAVAIGNSDLFAEEKPGIDAKKLVDHKVAAVGITPIVNKKDGIKNLTLNQLRDVFAGKIKNWKEVGGKDIPIVLVNRSQGSGTRSTFERWVMRGKQPAAAQEQDSTGMVRQIVSSTPGAISYVAFTYVDKTVQSLSIDNVQPLDKNVENNTWPIWSYEHMYTKGQPTGLTKKFMQYVLSPSIQESILPKMGYIPISHMQVSRDANGRITAAK
ncbi:phosphate transport system substrate-binding protein [Lactobacillus selangorensis]|uniref:Phosphate-binding protein n=1 Tax=Lactobacillus selangorensis TaxID=81857 RepID=A0A0R2G3W3_9LACO|nr:phosphate ABC transporter substrate-binding protein PstS family protein [Lactobacillus selangorensis]KRN28478.1 phosphate transport system substrate-binding protein [Lactobacillus selangorensis]KRN31978.1 phosphate transport system substrate-binding protein [Lactobacillus selangorensis]